MKAVLAKVLSQDDTVMEVYFVGFEVTKPVRKVRE